MTNQDIKQFNARFDRIDTKFDQIDNKFDQIDGKFDRIDRRFDEHDSKFEAFTSRFDKLLVFLTEQFKDIRSDMSGLATKTELADVKSELKGDIQEVKEIVQRLDRRTDEDMRATIKDVQKIKTYLGKHGHQI
jgi:predicted nuclease with TOPRIM domain